MWVDFVHATNAANRYAMLPKWLLKQCVLKISVCVCLCTAEMQQLDNHRWFGRGGSGAPIRDAHGNLLTDYSSRRVHSSAVCIWQHLQPVSCYNHHHYYYIHLTASFTGQPG